MGTERNVIRAVHLIPARHASAKIDQFTGNTGSGIDPVMLPGIFLQRDQYCTDRRCNFGSTMSAVRLHPHREAWCSNDKFPIQPVWNFELELPLDLTPGRRTVCIRSRLRAR
jgi:hypothetical protein